AHEQAVRPAAQDSVTALLERGRTLSTPVLRAAVDRLAPPMNTVAAYHFGWIDAARRPTDGDSGQARRPAPALPSAGDRAATRKLIDGQAQDISFEHRERVTVEECLEMEGNKTGALLACASSIGAVLGGADDATADALEAYGYHLGLAFQAVDDLLGIWGEPEATGKQTWSDLRQRKKSLPVVAALAAGGPGSER